MGFHFHSEIAGFHGCNTSEVSPQFRASARDPFPLADL